MSRKCQQTSAKSLCLSNLQRGVMHHFPSVRKLVPEKYINMVTVCILDIPDLCSARYISKDKQIYKDLLFKKLIFQNMVIFLIFPFSISCYYCQIEKNVFLQYQIYNGKTLVIDESI